MGLNSAQDLKETSPPIKRETLLYWIIFLNSLMTVMNTTMFNVALPDISEQFQINAKSASLVVSSYSIVFALGAVLYGKLSSFIPIKTLITTGIILLSIGSLTGMLSTSFPVLIAARIIQALGAAAITALSVIITTRYVPLHRRGKRLGQVASAVTLGFGLGPLIGGSLTQFLGWEYLFAVSLIGLIGIPFYLLFLPFEKGRREVFDYVGMLLFFAATVLLISGVTYSWLFIPLSLVIFIYFYFHINRHELPFMHPALLKNKVYIRVLGIGFVIFFINFSMLFLLPFVLSESFGIGSAAIIGLILFPGALTASIVSIFIGRAVDRFGPEKIMLFGIMAMPVALILALVFGQISVGFVILIFSVSSSSFVCITTSLPNIIAKALPKEHLTIGIGTLQLIQFTSGAIGVTISGKLITLFKELYPGYNEYFLIFMTLFFISLIAIVIYLLFFKNMKRMSASC